MCDFDGRSWDDHWCDGLIVLDEIFLEVCGDRDEMRLEVFGILN